MTDVPRLNAADAARFRLLAHLATEWSTPPSEEDFIAAGLSPSLSEYLWPEPPYSSTPGRPGAPPLPEPALFTARVTAARTGTQLAEVIEQAMDDGWIDHLFCFARQVEAQLARLDAGGTGSPPLQPHRSDRPGLRTGQNPGDPGGTSQSRLSDRD